MEERTSRRRAFSEGPNSEKAKLQPAENQPAENQPAENEFLGGRQPAEILRTTFKIDGSQPQNPGQAALSESAWLNLGVSCLRISVAVVFDAPIRVSLPPKGRSTMKDDQLSFNLARSGPQSFHMARFCLVPWDLVCLGVADLVRLWGRRCWAPGLGLLGLVVTLAGCGDPLHPNVRRRVPFGKALELATIKAREELPDFLEAMENPPGDAAGFSVKVEMAAGKPLFEKPLRHGGTVMAMAFSPDGSKIATGGGSQAAWVWDVAKGWPLSDPMKHNGDVLAVAFSPDGKTLLTGSADSTARLWEAATGQSLGQPLRHQDSVVAVAFGPDGKTVLTGSKDGTARLWEVATGQPIGQPLQHQDSVVAVAFHPKGKTVLTASADGSARLWEATSGKAVGQPMKHDDPVNSAVFSPQGTKVLTSSADGTARLWEADDGKPVGKPLGHPSGVLSAAFSPDGQTILTAGSDHLVRLWDVVTGKLKDSIFEDSLVSAGYSPKGNTLLACSEDHTARLWNASTGELLSTLEHEAPIATWAFSPDGQKVLTGGQDFTARLWDTTEGSTSKEVWLLFISYKDGFFTGQPLQSPFGTQAFQTKLKVRAEADKIIDWHYFQEGVLQGGYTMRVRAWEEPPLTRQRLEKQMGVKIPPFELPEQPLWDEIPPKKGRPSE